MGKSGVGRSGVGKSGVNGVGQSYSTHVPSQAESNVQVSVPERKLTTEFDSEAADVPQGGADFVTSPD